MLRTRLALAAIGIGASGCFFFVDFDHDAPGEGGAAGTSSQTSTATGPGSSSGGAGAGGAAQGGGGAAQGGGGGAEEICGDAALDEDEGCDDDNLDSGDGCGSFCETTLDPYATSPGEITRVAVQGEIARFVTSTQICSVELGEETGFPFSCDGAPCTCFNGPTGWNALGTYVVVAPDGDAYYSPQNINADPVFRCSESLCVSAGAASGHTGHFNGMAFMGADLVAISPGGVIWRLPDPSAGAMPWQREATLPTSPVGYYTLSVSSNGQHVGVAEYGDGAGARVFVLPVSALVDELDDDLSAQGSTFTLADARQEVGLAVFEENDVVVRYVTAVSLTTHHLERWTGSASLTNLDPGAAFGIGSARLSIDGSHLAFAGGGGNSTAVLCPYQGVQAPSAGSCFTVATGGGEAISSVAVGGGYLVGAGGEVFHRGIKTP